MELTLTELAEAKDLELGTSEYLKIDQDRIDRFAETTEDHQWIHVDPDRAAASPVGATIAPRYHVLALGLPVGELRAIAIGAGATINYGMDKLRFMSPVPVGSEVCLKARLLSGSSRRGGVLIRLRIEVRLREGGRRALVAEPLFLVQEA